MKTVLIAEPGSTPEGSLYDMTQLLDLAAGLGCRVFKNQWVSSPARLAERRHAPLYAQVYSAIHYPVEYHRELREHAHRLDMAYACSVYLPEDVPTLLPVTDLLKVSSFEAQDPDMQRAVSDHLHQVIISTGMMDEDAMSRLNDAVPLGECRAVLHCVSAYPAPSSAMNLGVFWHWSLLTGLSDHSCHPLTGAIAVAAGARQIEFHLRLDSCREENPDFMVSRSPEEAQEYVKNIVTAETMLGTGHKAIQRAEEPMLGYRVRGDR